MSAQLAEQTVTTYHYQSVGEVEMFYRAAGDPRKPVLLLLHGFPSSSYQFRDLIPRLAPHYRVIAPDLPGFGATIAPPRERFEYRFDTLADIVDQFTQAMGLDRYALYMFDYGAPVGLRLACTHPQRISALISQNGNAYAEGLTQAWAPLRAYWHSGAEADRDALRTLLTRETTEWQYTEGVPASLRDRVGPDPINHDQAILDRSAEIQLDLFGDYQNNVEAYPRWQAYLRQHQPPLLAVWGRNDPFFATAGAQAFAKDLPDARIVLLDTGHFALETHGTEIAEHVHAFLSEHTSGPTDDSRSPTR